MLEVTPIYKFGYQVSLDTSLFGTKEFLPERNKIRFDDKGTFLRESESESKENMINDSETKYNEVYLAKGAPKYYKKFEEIESVGTEIFYRCTKCGGCSDCLQSKNIHCISIQEEVKQALIDKSVKVNLDQNRTSALLPFLSDTVTKLASNEKIALKIYRNQVTNLNKRKKDKEDVLKAENKLHDLRFVEYVENLTIEEQNKIFPSSLLYFLPWVAVWNSNSVSTPCRPVFDASHPTSTRLVPMIYLLRVEIT